MTITDTVANKFYKTDEELGFDLAKAINIEVKRLVEAGCKYIQIDEPLFARKPEEALNYGIRNLEICFEGINNPNTFKVVVLPEPVPPATKILDGAEPIPSANIHNSEASLGDIVPNFIKLTTVSGSFICFLIVIVGPFGETGGIVAFTRLPSGNLPSKSKFPGPTFLPTYFPTF